MLFQVLKIAWWAALALFPFALLRTLRQLATAIGCPPAGDCYVPGAGIIFNLELMIGAFIGFVVPVCLWRVARTSWQLWRRLRAQ